MYQLRLFPTKDNKTVPDLYSHLLLYISTCDEVIFIPSINPIHVQIVRVIVLSEVASQPVFTQYAITD